MNTTTLIKAQRLQADIKNNNHILHLLLSVITAGLWVPVWMLCCLSQVCVIAQSVVRSES